MRAYLIKDEGTYERLALEKYQEDEKNSNRSGSRGTPYSSIGSKKKKGKGKKKAGSYNNSSDEGANLSFSNARGGKSLNHSRGSDKYLKNNSSIENEEEK